MAQSFCSPVEIVGHFGTDQAPSGFRQGLELGCPRDLKSGDRKYHPITVFFLSYFEYLMGALKRVLNLSKESRIFTNVILKI